MTEVTGVTNTIRVQTLFLRDLGELDSETISEVFTLSRDTVERKLHLKLEGVLKQFGKLQPASFEIAKSLLTYSWRQKQDEFMELTEASLVEITSNDNPRWTTFKNGLVRLQSMTLENYQEYRRKFIMFESELACFDLIDEVFKYEYSAALRMYHATKAMLRQEQFTNSLLHPDQYVKSEQRVIEFYQLKQEELNTEHEVLTGCRANIQALAGTVLPLWTKAFDNRIRQVESDIKEVNEALSNLLF